jgi:hypothetical protein
VSATPNERRPEPEPDDGTEPRESVEAAEQELEYPPDETDEG